MGARARRAWLRAYLANDGRGVVRNLVRPALWHRAATAPSTGSGGSRPCRQPWGHTPVRCGRLNSRSRCPSALRRSPQASTCRQRGSRSEALTASAPVAGGHMTDMVCFVKLFGSGAQRPFYFDPPCKAKKSIMRSALGSREGVPGMWYMSSSTEFR